MASTDQGRRLTERHRRDQVALRSMFLARAVPLWPLLDWRRIDETAPGWIQAVLALIRVFRRESADLSVRYYSEYRRVEVPRAVEPAPEIEFVQPAELLIGRSRLAPARSEVLAGRAEPITPSPRPDPVRTLETVRNTRPAAMERAEPDDGLVKPRIDWSEWDKAAETSLAVTGPGELKRQAKRAVPEERARRVALVTSSGAASRHVLTGGREAQMRLIRADDAVKGYIRVTDEDPCSFCAVLASRGIVYKKSSFSGVNRRTGEAFKVNPRLAGLSLDEAKVHDNCACQIEPVLVRNAHAWPGRAREFQRLWYEATKGYGGKDALNAFRRAYEAQRRERGLARPISA